MIKAQALLIIVILSCAACSPNVELHMFNNTPSNVLVTFKGRTGIKNTVVGGQQLLDFSSSEFDIEMDGCVLSYQMHGLPPSDYIVDRGLSRHINLQLESDGRIYLLHVGDRAPVDIVMYEQPNNLPLIPRRDCHNDM